MRRVLSFATILLLTPAALVARSGVAQQVMQDVTVNHCPVGLTVGRHADGSLLPAGGAPSMRVQQWLDLEMHNAGRRAILGVDLEVHGTEPKNHVVSASTSGTVFRDDDGGDAIRHVHLDSRVAAASTWTHLLAVEGLSSVAWVDVTELQYGDGSQWHAKSGLSCRVVPSPLMPVANR